MELTRLLADLGLNSDSLCSGDLSVQSPIDGSEIARIHTHTPDDADAAVSRAELAYQQWRLVPPPRRGELIRLFSLELRAKKQELARLVTIESGKILQESLGEVQENLDANALNPFGLGIQPRGRDRRYV